MAGGRKFAVFDIDGTLIRWQLYHAVADELARQGQFGPIEYQKIREARLTWKKRQSDDSFRTYEQALVNLVDAAMTGLAVEDVLAACRQVIREYKDQVYTYTRDLIGELKARDYLLFAISASQAEIVGMLAEYYGFDDYGGTTYVSKDGFYSGEKTVLKSDRKPELLRELAVKHGAIWQGSIAVGDSESDIPMLSTAEQPVAFNPTRDLFEHAKANNWKVVVERKNVIYRLEPGDDSYHLG